MIAIGVKCYEGYRGEETPRALRIGSNRIGVKKVLDRWLAPDHRYFKLLGDDDSVYLIRHDIETLRWELTFYSHCQDNVPICR